MKAYQIIKSILVISGVVLNVMIANAQLDINIPVGQITTLNSNPASNLLLQSANPTIGLVGDQITGNTLINFKSTGGVGIGVRPALTAKLDINPISTIINLPDVTYNYRSALQLRGGIRRPSADPADMSQILFSSAFSGQFTHSIRSFHSNNPAFPNELVFNLWQHGQIPSVVGNLEVMRLSDRNGGSVGIGNSTPVERLDVGGGIRIGNTITANAGTIRYNGTDLEGFVNGSWRSLTSTCNPVPARTNQWPDLCHFDGVEFGGGNKLIIGGRSSAAPICWGAYPGQNPIDVERFLYPNAMAAKVEYHGWSGVMAFQFSPDFGGSPISNTPGGQVAWTTVMRMTNAGKVVIGDDDHNGAGFTTPNGLKLAVDGGIAAKEIIVEVGPNWSDYVFDENYVLPSLDSLNAFISENHHLPGVPSAEEVKEKGVNLGEMDATLLKKIEELTLYLFQANRKIEELYSKIID